MFAVEAAVCLGGPSEDDPDAPLWGIQKSVAFLKKNGVGPTLDLADWFLDEFVYQNGEYVQIRAFLQNLYDVTPDHGLRS